MSRVLVVEDDPLFRRLARLTLEAAGFEIEEASDASDLVSRVDRRTIRLVLMDLGLPPPMDGIEACRRLRETYSSERLPIIVVSAHASDHDRANAAAAGSDAFVAKPFDPRELLRCVRDCCDR